VSFLRSASFDARITILTEMSCSHQKKSLARPLQRPQAAHKLQKIVSMNAVISKTMKERELGFQI